MYVKKIDYQGKSSHLIFWFIWSLFLLC